MKIDFLDGFEYFTGVPDSLLSPLCNYLFDKYGISENHVIAANEGNAVGLAAGYHLATGKVPVVYMQNSGLGNIVNPVASLLNDKVYGIPCLFIVGWRGEPGVHDEPQHVFQGEITVSMLENLDIATFILSKDTERAELDAALARFEELFKMGKQAAIVVKKGALEFDKKIKFKNDNTMLREDIIKHIAAVTGEDVIVSTTGKASRELFEIREAQATHHGRDFLTVGSMGHSSSIALGIAQVKTDRKIWIVDGDGAALMHLGSMATLGAKAPCNIVHVVINNGSHETVGGLPTVAEKIDLVAIAKGCGYPNAVSVDSFEALDVELGNAKARNELSFIEVKCAIGARADLGRPTTTAKQNKESFMEFLK